MYRPYVRAINPRDAREVFGKTSQSNQFQVTFNGIPSGLSSHLRQKFNVSNAAYFMGSKGNLLCSEASLPASSLATQSIDNDFVGISQEFAHKRLYTDIDFTYMIDYDYTILRIFEGWIDYISSGSETLDGLSETSDNYYRRMRYPDAYKSQSMFVTKFEKDFQYRIDYQFYNIFPKMMTAIPLSYGGAEILKLTVSFNYDRYIVNPKENISRGAGILPSASASGSSTSGFTGQSGELGAWVFGAEESLKTFQEMNASGQGVGNIFNIDPQMYKGLTNSQISDAYKNASTWTTNGGSAIATGERTLSNTIFDYGGSLKFRGSNSSGNSNNSSSSSGSSSDGNTDS